MVKNASAVSSRSGSRGWPRPRSPRPGPRAGTRPAPPARHGWRRRRACSHLTVDARSLRRTLLHEPVDPSRRHGGHPTQQPRHAPGKRGPRLACVLILLPPSETKTGRTTGAAGRPVPALLPRADRPARRRGPRARRGQRRRRRTGPARRERQPHRGDRPQHAPGLLPAVTAAELYTGVLYDALDLPSLDPVARRRAGRWLVVVSALYGALRPGDKVAPYRLSMGVNLRASARSPRSGASLWPRCSPGPPGAGWWSTAAPARTPPRGRRGAARRPLGAGEGARCDAHGQAHPWPGGAAPVPGGPRRPHPTGPPAGGGTGVRDHPHPSAAGRSALGPRHERQGAPARRPPPPRSARSTCSASIRPPRAAGSAQRADPRRARATCVTSGSAPSCSTSRPTTPPPSGSTATSASSASARTCRTGADPSPGVVADHQGCVPSLTPRPCFIPPFTSTGIGVHRVRLPSGSRGLLPAPRDCEVRCSRRNLQREEPAARRPCPSRRGRRRRRCAPRGLRCGQRVRSCRWHRAEHQQQRIERHDLNGAGSSAQEAAMEAWIAGFQARNPDVDRRLRPGRLRRRP